MREVRPGDLVLHLLRRRWDDGVDEKRLCAYSIVASPCEERVEQPPAPGEWGGRDQYYRVPLKDFTPLPQPISITSFGERNVEEIRREALDSASEHYPFATYGDGVRMAQGRYLARCTPRLYHLFSTAVDPVGSGVPMDQVGRELLNKIASIPQEVLSSPSASKFDPASEYPAKTWVASATALNADDVGVKFVTAGRLRHATGEPKPAKLGVFILDGSLSDRFVEASLPNIGHRRRFDHALVIERAGGTCRASAVIGSPSDPLGIALRALFPDVKVHEVSVEQRSTGHGPLLNVILYGPPGTGKTYQTVDRALELCGVVYETREEADEEYQRLVDAGRISFVTFHQSFAYEDFVEGIRPSIENGQLLYDVRDGVFKEICERARSSNEPFVLIIDEINRANVSKVFGELITLVEEDKRIGGSEEKKAILPYSRADFGVPSNVFIIATMNSADRSVASIDHALRRRFSFIELMPDPGCIRERGLIGGFDVGELLDVMNQRIEFLLDRDHTIGHSYFLKVGSLDELGEVMRSRILPLLQEYFHGDLSKVASVLGCGFDEEGRSRNQFPIVCAELITAGDLFGADATIDDRIRPRVSDDFLRAQGPALLPFLKGVVSR